MLSSSSKESKRFYLKPFTDLLKRDAFHRLLITPTLVKGETLSGESFVCVKQYNPNLEPDEGEFFKAFIQNTSVTALECSGFTEKTKHKLVKILNVKKSLTSLSILNFGKVGDDVLNLAVVIKYLAASRSLQTLELGWGDFTVQNANDFLVVLKDHPTLKEFNIVRVSASNSHLTEGDKKDDGCTAAQVIVEGLKGSRVEAVSIKTKLATLLEEAKSTDDRTQGESIKSSVNKLFDICIKKSVPKIEGGLMQPGLLALPLFNQGSDREKTCTVEINRDEKIAFLKRFLPGGDSNEKFTFVLDKVDRNFKFSSLKTMSQEILSRSGKEAYNLQYIVFTERDLTSSKTKLKKRYFLVKNTKEIQSYINRLFELMPSDFLENLTLKEARVNAPAEESTYWDSGWEDSLVTHVYYRRINDPMITCSLAKNFNKVPKAIVVEIGGGVGRLIAPVTGQLLSMGCESVNYAYIEPSTDAFKQATSQLSEAKKRYGEKLTFFPPQNKQFDKANLTELKGKAHVVFASGVFTTQTMTRVPNKDAKASPAERDLMLVKDLLDVDNGIAIFTGFKGILFNKKEFEQRGMRVVRSVFKFKLADDSITLHQCYVVRIAHGLSPLNVTSIRRTEAKDSDATPASESDARDSKASMQTAFTSSTSSTLDSSSTIFTSSSKIDIATIKYKKGVAEYTAEFKRGINKNYQPAVKFLCEALAMFEAEKNTELHRAKTYSSLASCYREMEDHAQAKTCLDEALAIYKAKSYSADSDEMKAIIKKMATIALKLA